jgi:uncharacterized protein (DUF1501 family)
MKESRRQFLKKSVGAMGMTTIAAQMGSFGMMNALANAVAGSERGGYKALVLVFLAGGNDGNNTVVPKHDNIPYFGISNYADYAANRGVLAIPRASLIPIIPPSMGLEYGLHPSLGSVPNGNDGIADLWEKEKMAIVTNVGTLVHPTTRSDYITSAHQMPLQLFSHADQVEQQQSAYADGTDYKGWGGRISSIMSPNPDNVLPMMTSIAGSQLFVSGGPTPLVLADGRTPLDSIFKFDHIGSLTIPSMDPAFQALVTPSPSPSSSPAKFVQGANTVTKRALDARASFSANSEVTNPALFPNTGIGKQLLQVARVIKLSRPTTFSTGLASRQIFFCQLGGFDTHSHQLGAQAGLLSQLSQAVRAFYDEMDEQGAGSEVTTFTMSDFSRTLRPNGTTSSAGTDHAWGNHAFVIGGAVNGGNFYGINNPTGTPFPRLAVDDADDADSGTGASGRWVPTTAVEEYAAVLARWFGLKESFLPSVFPNYENFTGSGREGNLGFLPF